MISTKLKYYLKKAIITLAIVSFFIMVGTTLETFSTAKMAGSGVMQLNGGDAEYAASKALSKFSGSVTMSWTMLICGILVLLYWVKDILSCFTRTEKKV